MIVNPISYQQGVKLPELENPGTAADLLAGKQLVDQYGNPLTGTMPTATHPKPTLSRSGGTVTAQHVQSAGYTEGGTTAETLTIPTKAGTTITPGTSRKTAVSSGYLTTGAVYVAGDTNLKAENIKSGVSIFGVAGSLSGAEVAAVSVVNNSDESLGIQHRNISGGIATATVPAKSTNTVNIFKGSIVSIYSSGTLATISAVSSGITIMNSNTSRFKLYEVDTRTGKETSAYLLFGVSDSAGTSESITIS